MPDLVGRVEVLVNSRIEELGEMAVLVLPASSAARRGLAKRIDVYLLGEVEGVPASRTAGAVARVQGHE